MLTKKQYCIAVIRRYAASHGYIFNYKKALQGKRGPDVFVGQWVYESSIVACAALYLGILDKEEERYARSRDGIVEMYVGDDDITRTLTAQEFIDLLPEEE